MRVCMPKGPSSSISRGSEMLVEAANTFLPNTHEGKGILVALAPPQRVVDALQQEGGEPADELHVTLAYLGRVKDYDSGHVAALPGHLDEWAARHPGPQMSVEGAGTFLDRGKGDGHVLHALVNAPGLHRLHSDLVDHLKINGYEPSEDYGYLPHMTLGYTRHHVRFLPKIPRVSWKASRVWSSVGGNRRSHLFGQG